MFGKKKIPKAPAVLLKDAVVQVSLQSTFLFFSSF
jgi:hypothetical protein